MYTRKSKNHTATKFAEFVHFVCGTTCTKFCSERTTFDKVIIKNTKNTDGPKFADLSMATVSPYFKSSMISGMRLNLLPPDWYQKWKISRTSCPNSKQVLCASAQYVLASGCAMIALKFHGRSENILLVSICYPNSI